MAAPQDTQVGNWYWDLALLDWKKVTLDDVKELLDGSQYTRKYAYTAGGLLEYAGLAEPGTSSASVGWKIIKYTYNGSDNLTDAQFASGEAEFSHIWDNRASYSYS
jgi:hypothetical protein